MSLQVYFSGVVVPAVSTSVAELSSASSALLSLIRAVEDSITVVLRKCVDACISEVRGIWGWEGRREGAGHVRQQGDKHVLGRLQTKDACVYLCKKGQGHVAQS